MRTSEALVDLARTFDLLSDETRLAVVRELAAADAEPLRFSELRCRVGAADGGRFNYHLRRLRGSLVEQVDEGYVLTAVGRRAAAMVVAPAAAPEQ